MSKAVRFAAELNSGAGGNKRPQQDAVRAEAINTAGGVRLVLAVVADGDDGPAAGALAMQAINQFFAAAAASRQPDPGRVLEQALKAAAETIASSNGDDPAGVVSLAAAALHGRQLYWVSCGTARVYLVANDKVAEVLTTDTAERLAPGRREAAAFARPFDRAVRPGESVVVCSDGITQPRGADLPAFVTDQEIARWVKGSTPLKATRYLISEALGRNASDNLAVAVIQLAPGPLAAVTGLPALLGVGAVVLVLALFGGAWLLATGAGQAAPTQTPVPTPIPEFGFVVMVDGEADFYFPEGSVSGRITPGADPLQPGTTITATNSGAALQLILEPQPQQYTRDDARLFFGPQAAALLVQAAPEAGARTGITHYFLHQGAMLLLQRNSEWQFQIETIHGVFRLGAPRAQRALGVELTPQGGTALYCLAGPCEWQTDDANAEWVSVNTGQTQLLSKTGNQAGPALDRRRWEALCNCPDLPGATAVPATASPTATP